MTETERIWTAARNRCGDWQARRTPSAAQTAVLLELANGPAYVGEIARRTGVGQGNLSYTYLRTLDRYGFAVRDEIVPGLGNQGGGRPAMYWRLTRAGRELAAALEAEGVVERGVA